MASIDLSSFFSREEFAEFSTELTRATCSDTDVYIAMAIAGMERGSPQEDVAAAADRYILAKFSEWRSYILSPE